MVRLVAKANKTAQVFLCLNLSRTTVSCMYRDGCYDTCSYDFHTFLWAGLETKWKDTITFIDSFFASYLGAQQV